VYVIDHLHAPAILTRVLARGSYWMGRSRAVLVLVVWFYWEWNLSDLISRASTGGCLRLFRQWIASGSSATKVLLFGNRHRQSVFEGCWTFVRGLHTCALMTTKQRVPLHGPQCTVQASETGARHKVETLVGLRRTVKRRHLQRYYLIFDKLNKNFASWFV
jgi:hypothetical protein